MNNFNTIKSKIKSLNKTMKHKKASDMNHSVAEALCDKIYEELIALEFSKNRNHNCRPDLSYLRKWKGAFYFVLWNTDNKIQFVDIDRKNIDWSTRNLFAKMDLINSIPSLLNRIEKVEKESVKIINKFLKKWRQ